MLLWLVVVNDYSCLKISMNNCAASSPICLGHAVIHPAAGGVYYLQADNDLMFWGRMVKGPALATSHKNEDSAQRHLDPHLHGEQADAHMLDFAPNFT